MSNVYEASGQDGRPMGALLKVPIPTQKNYILRKTEVILKLKVRGR
jgi:hypothetical protein